jgi:hypothetical protein
MENSTIDFQNLTIGSKIFVVHRDYMNKKKQGGMVLPARVVAFKNVKGFINPIFRLIGNKWDISVDCYHVFTDIKEAINSIRS